ncbi:MAG: hypothetical protein L0H53_10155 [Candidatus Nitrosocosmicus sp.]|nr:hypothetical protein [Candidatus Nitrosocosmicus sp.]
MESLNIIQYTGKHQLEESEIYLTKINPINNTSHSDTTFIGHRNSAIADTFDKMVLISWINKDMLNFKVIEANKIP